MTRPDALTQTTATPRGAVIRLFGVIFIMLGTLNTMLSWRGGFELLSLPVFMIAGGLILCLIGVIIRQSSA